MRILVVDDERQILTLCQRVLTRAGYQVATAGGFREAAALIPQGPYDLLITDLRLPDGSGWDVAKSFQETFPEGKIIVISGCLEGDPALLDLPHWTLADFLAKPFHVNMLRDTVQRALGAGTRV